MDADLDALKMFGLYEPAFSEKYEIERHGPASSAPFFDPLSVVTLLASSTIIPRNISSALAAS